jgi:hypothetical protein
MLKIHQGKESFVRFSPFSKPFASAGIADLPETLAGATASYGDGRWSERRI